MARAARGVDLSFLNEEEAQQIFHVLERDSRLKRAERERISKLYKKKEDTTLFPGVTGEWFEEIQRRKFQSETEVSKMIKQPLAHRLRKAMKTDSTTVKPSAPQSPQAQKNSSPSILGGLRTPFVSLFSSFRKPKRPPLKPPASLPPQHLHPPRYDRFVPGCRTSSKVEEMAKTETCNSPLATKLTNKRLDAKQATEDSSSTWNEQLEKELLRVLGSLDEQLAQEQAQGPAKRRTTTDYGHRISDTNQYPTVTRQSFRRGVQRNGRSMFLPDGARTLRPREEHQNLFRPRTLYDTYMKKYHVEDYANRNVLDRRSSVPKGWCSTRSLGHSSEGSLEHLSGPRGSGFQRRDFPCTNTVSRSYSLSSLSRRHSSGSADQLSTEGLQHPLAAEGNRRFMQRNYHHHSKRTPLSSVVWNTPHCSEHPLVQDRILRTQSLMDFAPKFEDTYPCSPRDNTKYEFYRSQVNHRGVVPNPSHLSRVGYPDKLTDSLCFDNWENYALCQPERNIASPCYRYSSLRGRKHLFHKRFPSGRMEGQLFGPDSNQYYNDEPFLTSDADLESIPTNLNDWQSACAKNTGLPQRESSAQNNVVEHMRNMDCLEGQKMEEFLKHSKDIENHPTYTSTAPLPFIRARASNQSVLSDLKGPAKYAAQRQNLFTRSGQTLVKPLVTHTKAKEDLQPLVSEELRDTGQSSRAGSGDLKEGISGPVSGEVDTNHPTECPPKNSLAAVPQSSASLKPPVSLGSNIQAKSAPSRDTETMYLSSTQNRNGQNKGNDHALNSDLDQISHPRLTGIRTRDSFFQSLQRGTHHSERLKVSMHKQQHENIRASGFGRALKVFECDEISGPCPEKSNKDSCFVRHATSNSITGSPSSSPPISPVMCYTLPRKSASIDGSIISQKPLCSPKRRVSFENQEDNLDTLESNRNERSSWNQMDKIAFASPAHSSLLKDVTYEGNIPLTEGHHPDHSFSATNNPVRKLEKSTITCCLDKTETTVLSDCEEMDAENSLQKCKTTSMVTVSVDEDNIKYHELISVYYTLPRKHSRTLGKLFLHDSNNVGSSPPSGQSPSKKCVHAGLEAAGFPCNLEKADLPAKISPTPGMPQNSKIPDKSNVEGDHVRNPITNLLLAPHSQLMESNRKETAEDLIHAQAVSGNRPPSLSPSNLKIPSGNVVALSSTLNTRNVQKESCLGCQPLDQSTVSNNPHILSSRLMDNEKRKCVSDPATNAPVSSTEEKMRQDTKVRERARHICHILALHSKKGNGLQPRHEGVPSGIGETLTSQTTAQSHSENQTLQVEAATVVNTSLQPNIPVASVLKSPNSKQERMLQNNPVHTVYTSSQISVNNSVDNQNINSEDHFPNTTLDLPDGSTTETNLTLDNTHGETEKRKNRPSIKNKLSAMCKTGRKFSNKKNLNPKPHVNTIFSQNDAPSSEISEPLFISSVVPQFLQIGIEDQNQNPLPPGLENTMSGRSENKKSQTQEGPPLVTNENRRPFTNLCNQKRETDSSRHSNKNIESHILDPAGLCRKEREATLKNSKAHDEGLENSNCPIVSRVNTRDLSQKKKDGTTIGESSLFSPSFDKNSNHLTESYSKANICPQQKAVSPTGYDHYQNIKHSNRLKSQNLPHAEPSPSKLQRERHFSESSYTREPHKILAPKSSLIHHNRRKFNSYSELLSCDENENWEAYSDPNRTFGSRQLMYPSVEFGIFGKEQQQAFLDNIKRSLTEGRLWSPCLLKNPGFLRKEEGCSLNKSELLSSSFAERNKSEEGSSEKKPVDVCEEEVPVGYSESDSDTTTDDEYYPNEHDKESEL